MGSEGFARAASSLGVPPIPLREMVKAAPRSDEQAAILQEQWDDPLLEMRRKKLVEVRYPGTEDCPEHPGDGSIELRGGLGEPLFVESVEVGSLAAKAGVGPGFKLVVCAHLKPQRPQDLI